MTTTTSTDPTRWYARDVDDVVAQLESDISNGLTSAEVGRRLQEHGHNVLRSEPPPSKLEIASKQVADPMNLMLIGVSVISLAIGEVATAAVVGVLVLLNVWMGTKQELKAKADAEAEQRLRATRR